MTEASDRFTLVDLVVTPDGRSTWKDLDEYEHGRKVGFTSDWQHRHVQQARHRAEQKVADGCGPIGEGWDQ